MTSPRPLEHPAPTPQAPGFRVGGLDGLRAIAVIAVLLFHLGPDVLPGGYLGVDVFFVISGFLITTLLVREHEQHGRIRLGAFWLRRARRLLPALLLVVLAAGSAALAVGGDTVVRLGSQLLGAATFSSNWLFIAQGASYFDQSAPELFRNLWSLAVEEQFYLVWPLVVLLLVPLPRRARAVAALAIAGASLLAMAVLAPAVDATRAYFGTDTHSFGLAFGAALAFVAGAWPADRAAWPRATRALLSTIGTVSLLGIVALALWMPEAHPLVFAGGLGLVAVLTVLLIEALLVPGAWLGRALDVAPLRWIGVRSYGLYLWHWPVWVLLGAALPAWPREGASGWALGGVALALTVVAATGSYALVERPIRRDGLRRTARLAAGRWRSGGAASATAATLTVLMVLGGGVATGLAVASDPGKSETQVQVEAGRRAIEGTASSAPEPGPTAPPTPPGGDQIVVIGDSVTVAAAEQLQSTLPGVAIDATVSRQMAAAPAIVEGMAAAGALRTVLVLALGTNGPIDEAALERVRDTLGPDRELVLVTAQAPRGWTDGVNATLADFARRYRNVELSNWHEAVQPHLGELNSDQVHFGPTGARIWTATLTAALQRLAELPPVRSPRDYESVPRPV